MDEDIYSLVKPRIVNRRGVMRTHTCMGRGFGKRIGNIKPTHIKEEPKPSGIGYGHVDNKEDNDEHTEKPVKRTRSTVPFYHLSHDDEPVSKKIAFSEISKELSKDISKEISKEIAYSDTTTSSEDSSEESSEEPNVSEEFAPVVPNSNIDSFKKIEYILESLGNSIFVMQKQIESMEKKIDTMVSLFG